MGQRVHHAGDLHPGGQRAFGFVAELDGRGAPEIISASFHDSKIAWYGDRDYVGDVCDCSPADPAIRRPPEVEDLVLARVGAGFGSVTLSWNTTVGADRYAVTRGLISGLFWGDFGTCLLLSVLATSVNDSGVPPPGAGFAHLVNGRSLSCGSGALGFVGDSERINLNALGCPP